MTVTFYNFSKRINSTKQPSGAGTDVNVTLKEPTSVTDPVLVLEGNHLTDFTYAHIPSFNRYYFVGEVVSIANGLTQLTLHEDYLASHKGAVSNTKAHVAYSSTGWNKHINDMRMTVKQTKQIYTATASSGFDTSTGYYVVGILNDIEVTTGAVCYYILSPYNFQKLLDNLTDDTVGAQIAQIFNGKQMDSIVSCQWLPLSNSNWQQAVGNLSERVHIGKLVLGVSQNTYECVGWKVTTPIINLLTTEGYQSATLAFPFRYQDFRDNQPYTSASLYLPGVGLTDINANDFYESTGVMVNAKYDVTTGDIIYWIADAGTGTVLKTLSFNCAIDVPLAQITTNGKGGFAAIGGTVVGAATALAGFGTGNVAAGYGGVVAALNGASNAAMAFNQRSTSIKGSNNGRGDFVRTDYQLVLVVMDTENVDDSNYIATMGRPVGETNTLSSHSGYIQCDNASVSGNMFETERTRLNSYLNSGFYLE